MKKILHPLICISIILNANQLFSQANPCHGSLFNLTWQSILNTQSSSIDQFYGGSSPAGGCDNANYFFNDSRHIKLSPNQNSVGILGTSQCKQFLAGLNSNNGQIDFQSIDLNLNKQGVYLNYLNDSEIQTVGHIAFGSSNSIFTRFNLTGGLVSQQISQQASSNRNNWGKVLSFNNQTYVYGVSNNPTTGFNEHTTTCYDEQGAQIWTSKIAELDWYYGYPGRMTTDAQGNVIFSGKRQTSQGNQNTYDVVLRKVNANGQQQWQIYYDYNNLADYLTSVVSDSEGNIYFSSINTNAWASRTCRLVKVNGNTGAIIFQTQISSSGGGTIRINSDGNVIVGDIDNQVNCYSPIDGSLIWSQAIQSYRSFEVGPDGKVFIVTNNSIKVLNSSGSIIQDINTSIAGFSTLNRMIEISQNGNSFYLTGERTVGSTSKLFVSKYQTNGLPTFSTINASICAGESILFGNQSIDSTGTYTRIVLNQFGCDSTITLNLNVNQPSTSSVDATITEGETYSFNGQNLTAAGTYIDTLQNAAGCDSLVTLNLTVEPAVEPFNCEITVSKTEICLGETTTLAVPFVPSAGNMLDTIFNRYAAFEYSFQASGSWKTEIGGWQTGNAPFGNTTGGEVDNNAPEFAFNTFWPTGSTLFVRKSINLDGLSLEGVRWKLGVDNGYNLYVNGNFVSGIYEDGFTSTWEYEGVIPTQFLNSGENIIALELTDGGFLTAFDMMLEGIRITESTSLLWSTGETTPSISVSPTETTVYNVIVNQGGQTCTSEVTITVNQPSAETVNATITEGETYSFNGQNLTTAGTYSATLQNAAGCDSVVALNLTVTPAPVSGCYAASVVNFTQGDSFDGTTVSAIRSNAEHALGMPEPVVTNVVNFVSLGFGGSITLAFEAPIANGAGNDIRIDEATWGNNPCNRYPERADVFASQDGVNFVYLGVACQDASFDLGALSWAQYVRIVDISDLLSFSHDADGFDVNGIECLNGAATSLNDDGLVACSLQEIVSYTPGNRKNGTPVASPRNNPANALGTPQNNNTINFTALGFGGTVVAKFDFVVFNQTGNDLRVTETSFGNPSCNNYPEKARVSVSMDNVNWTELGEICQDGEIDLGNVNYAQYIKIQDASPISSNKFNGAADGYDVDAVMVLNNGCGTSSARLAQMDNTTTLDASMSISAFPNPMEDYTIVNFEGLENDAEFTFQIMDAAGRVIRNNNIRISTANPTYLFDASELARGIYQVLISNENGSYIVRLVK